MANEPQISLQGNLTADSELRYTNSGKAVLNFTIACNPSRLINGEWQNGEPIFMRCVMWTRAELYAEHLMKGTRVYVAGLLEDASYIKPETEQKITAYQINVRHCGIIPKGTPQNQTLDWNTSAYVPPAAQEAPPAPNWDTLPQGDTAPF